MVHFMLTVDDMLSCDR